MIKKIILWALLSTMMFGADSSRAVKVFALMNPGDDKAKFDHYAAMSEVDGLAVRLVWGQIEPSEGRYDWNLLDAAISSVQKKNKTMTIHIGVSMGAVPQWLMQRHPDTYEFQTPFRNGIDVLPWDNQLISGYERLIFAVAKHLKEKKYDTVTAVSVGAPISEMSIPTCQNGWVGRYHYDKETYLKTWQRTILATATAFPHSTLFVSAPVRTICRPDNDGALFYAEVMDYASKVHRTPAIFVADLTAKGSQRFSNLSANVQKNYPLGMQTIWSSKDDPQGRMKGSVAEALDEGLKNTAFYFEIYQKDLEDQIVLKAIRAVKLR
jgi:hypothetical protein